LRMQYLAIVLLFSLLLTSAQVQNASAEPSELGFDNIHIGPYVDKVLYKIIPNENDRVQALLNNQIDILEGPIGAAYLSTLEAAPDIDVTSILRNGYGHLTINCRDNPLNYSVLRRAFAFAFDKTSVTEGLFGGLARNQDSLVPYVNPCCVEDEFEWHYYSDESNLGNQMLNNSGFTIDLMTGFRMTPFGDPFDIVIEYPSTSPDTGGVIAQIGVDALLSLHINARTRASVFNEYISRLNEHGDYDIIFYASNYYNYDVDWLATEYWSELADTPYQNPCNFMNDTYDAWRNQLLYGATYMEIYEAAAEMQKILHYNVPRLVVYEDIYHSAYRTDRFEGHVMDISKNIENEWTNLNAHLNLFEGGPFSGTLRVSIRNTPNSFNPMLDNSVFGRRIFANLFDTLIRPGPTGVLELGLAQSYLIETHADNSSVPTGHMRFTFDIFQNSSWSDGTPVIADDVAYTFYYYLQSGAYGNPLSTNLVGLIASYVPKPGRVILEFDSESYWYLSKISRLPILQKALLESIGLSGWNTWNPVFSADSYPTSGPFNLTDFSTENYIELKHSPLYCHRVRGTGSEQPVVTGPSSMFIVNGSTISAIVWNFTDDNPLVYRIFLNGSMVDAAYYENSTVQLDLYSQLTSLGLYNFTFQIQDWEYQSAIHTVIVNYMDDAYPPEISGPDDIIVGERNTLGTLLNWTVFDHNPANYSILLDDSEIEQGNWTSDTRSISYYMDALTVGEYNFTLILMDEFGLKSQDSVIVHVVDISLPEITHPDDMELDFGDTGFIIQWNATDRYPSIYTIFLDGKLNVTDSWESGILIVYSLDELEVGTHNITIIVFDVEGNSASDTVMVHITAPAFPISTIMLLAIGGVCVSIVIVGVILKIRK